MSKTIRDKILGCISGAAIGDAMGTPAEFLHHRAVKKYFGEIKDMRFGARFSDDTLLRMLTYRTIIEKGGRIDAWDMASSWKARVLPNDDYWVTELFISAELNMGVSPRDSGFHNIEADDAAMAIDPIGVVNCCSPRNAAVDARDIAAVSQKGKEVEAAIAVAAAVAQAFDADVTTDGVVEAARSFSGQVMARRIERALAVVGSTSSLAKTYDKLYEEVGIQDGSEMIVKTWRANDPKLKRYSSDEISLGVSAAEVVPVALAFFHMSNGDPFKTLKKCVGYGRDSDTLAGIAGAVAGAFKGAGSINSELIRQVESENQVSFGDLASAMIRPLRNASEESSESVNKVKKLLRLSGS
jgi:ADP-ribosylglycohydrolase